MRTIHVFHCPNCKAYQRMGGRTMLCQCGYAIGQAKCKSCQRANPDFAVAIGVQVRFFCAGCKPLMAIGEPVKNEPPKFKTSIRPVRLGEKRHVSRERDGKTRS